MITVNDYIKTLCKNALEIARYGYTSEALCHLEEASLILEALKQVGVCSLNQFLSLDRHILVHYHVIMSKTY